MIFDRHKTSVGGDTRQLPDRGIFKFDVAWN